MEYKKFTPGPWIIDYGGTIGHIKAIINDGLRITPTVARYDSSVCNQEEQKANANLISAVPELLEFAEDKCNTCCAKHRNNVKDEYCDTCVLGGIIAKAYGEKQP